MRKSRTPSKKAPVTKVPSTTPRKSAPAAGGRQLSSAPTTPQSARKSVATPNGSVKRRSYKPMFPSLVTESICCSCEKNECGTYRCNCVRNGVPCAPGRCKCDRRKCTNKPTGPEDAKLRYSALKRPLNPDASQGDVNLIQMGRTPYKRFHRPFMVDLRVEVRYQNRRNVFIVPSDTLFSELAIEAATFYGVISDKKEAGTIVASLFDSTGAVCPPNTKIALMTVLDEDHPLVLRCRRARRKSAMLSDEEEEDDEDNFIAGRADDPMAEDSMMRDGDDDDDSDRERMTSRKRLSSARRSRGGDDDDDDDNGMMMMSQQNPAVESQDFPGLGHSAGNSQAHSSQLGSTNVPHCHAAVGGATAECVPGCLFVITQGGTMLAPESHMFARDKPVRICGECVITENGNLYVCRVEKGIASFTVPASMEEIYRMCGGEHRVQCAATTENEIIVIASDSLFSINKASGEVRALLPGVQVSHVSGSRSFASAVDVNGRVYVWGDTTDLGVQPSIEPSPVHMDQPVQESACGLSHVLLLTRSGELYAFGRGDEGRLGLDSETSEYRPKKLCHFANEKDERVDEKSRFVSIACGRYHSAAVTEEGALYTWGGGKFGQLGLGSQSNQCVPRRVWGLRTVRIAKVACEVLSTAACDSRGNIWTCGFRMTPSSESALPGQPTDFLGGYALDVLGCIPHFTLNDQHIADISASDTGFFLALRGEFDPAGQTESNPIDLDGAGEIEL